LTERHALALDLLGELLKNKAMMENARSKPDKI
jgi:hypothetical protein